MLFVLPSFKCTISNLYYYIIILRVCECYRVDFRWEWSFIFSGEFEFIKMFDIFPFYLSTESDAWLTSMLIHMQRHRKAFKNPFFAFKIHWSIRRMIRSLYLLYAKVLKKGMMPLWKLYESTRVFNIHWELTVGENGEGWRSKIFTPKCTYQNRINIKKKYGRKLVQ